MDRTLILVKPDAFARWLTGEIIARFERKGLKIVALRHMTVERELAERHYAEHAERPFFGELVDFITSGPLVAMVLEGDDAVRAARQVIGATNPLEAAPGSIRGDFALRDGREHGPRLGLAGVRRRARRRCSSRTSPSPAGRADAATRSWPRARPSGGRSSSAWASRSRCACPRCRGAPSRRGGEPLSSRTRCQGARGQRPRARETVLGCDTVVALDGRDLRQAGRRRRRPS